MVRMFCSGVGMASDMVLLAEEGAPGMVNATNRANSPAMRRAYAEYPSVPLWMDSGAFQGNRDLAGYAATIKQIGDRMERIVNLDVIGSQVASDRNYQTLCELVPEVAEKILWVYQGGPLDYLKRMAEGRLVGIGGLVPRIHADLPAALDYILEVGETVASVGGSVHLFGVGNLRIIQAVRNQPWLASIDSARWKIGLQSRKLLTRAGRELQCDRLELDLTGRECAAQNIRVMQQWMTAPVLQADMFEGEEVVA